MIFFWLIIFVFCNSTQVIPATQVTLFSHHHVPLLPLPPLQMVSFCFTTCHISELTNPFLLLPPLQKANPHFQHAIFPSSLTCFSSSSPPGSESSFCDVPCFRAHQPTPPSSSPPGSESSFSVLPFFRPHQPLPPPSSPPKRHSLFLVRLISLLTPLPPPLFLPSSLFFLF